jgi:hypothetical protein
MSTKLRSNLLSFTGLLSLMLPFTAFADVAPGSTSTTDMFFTIAGHVSFLLFVLATILLFYAAKLFKKTAMYSVLLYFAIGTGMIVAQSAFIALGASFFEIEDESLDVWWHLLFYMAFAFHFVGLLLLTRLGTSEFDASPEASANSARLWGFIGICVAVAVFLFPRMLEPVMRMYTTSPLDMFGLHHFIAFIFAGIVIWYLMFARKNLGQIGRLIANPVIFAVTALSLQHFWELLAESWEVFHLESDVIEGVEKLFLIAGASALIWGAWKLIAFQKASTPAAPASSATPTA